MRAMTLANSSKFREQAADALEDGLHRARRAWKHGSGGLRDYRYEAAHLVRRQPLMAIGAALGVGLILGTGLALFRRT
jgi:ElaB/YqjD/DUF883 family membrane-anchored ribosome-binding protein